MVTVTARESFVYAGLDRALGDSFDASAEDARILTLMGKVATAETVVSPSGTRRVDAGPVAGGDHPPLAQDNYSMDAIVGVDVGEGTSRSSRRQYRRKDVIAE